MPKFIMLVGLPASGKSTLAEKLKEEYKAEIISSDSLRKELYNDEQNQEHNYEIFNEMLKRTIACLKEDKNVIYDATNISSKRRINICSQISKYANEKICYLLTTSYELCIKRNNERERKVPDEVIKRMLYSFNTPSIYEGFTKVIVVHSDEQKKLAEEVVDEKMQHDNPNHTASVAEHMSEVYSEVGKYSYNILKMFYPKGEEFEAWKDSCLLTLAAYYHDIGKFYTKSFDEKGIAHFYNHENVGAYIIFNMEAANILTDEELLDMSLLINWHMKPYFWKTEKEKEKARLFLSKRLFTLLMILHLFDETAD